MEGAGVFGVSAVRGGGRVLRGVTGLRQQTVSKVGALARTVLASQRLSRFRWECLS